MSSSGVTNASFSDGEQNFTHAQEVLSISSTACFLGIAFICLCIHSKRSREMILLPISLLPKNQVNHFATRFLLYCDLSQLPDYFINETSSARSTKKEIDISIYQNCRVIGWQRRNRFWRFKHHYSSKASR